MAGNNSWRICKESIWRGAGGSWAGASSESQLLPPLVLLCRRCEQCEPKERDVGEATRPGSGGNSWILGYFHVGFWFALPALYLLACHGQGHLVPWKLVKSEVHPPTPLTDSESSEIEHWPPANAQAGFAGRPRHSEAPSPPGARLCPRHNLT